MSVRDYLIRCERCDTINAVQKKYRPGPRMIPETVIPASAKGGTSNSILDRLYLKRTETEGRLKRVQECLLTCVGRLLLLGP
jgi:hypothetical protein